jgi:hypothetical protein
MKKQAAKASTTAGMSIEELQQKLAESADTTQTMLRNLSESPSLIECACAMSKMTLVDVFILDMMTRLLAKLEEEA